MHGLLSSSPLLVAPRIHPWIGGADPSSGECRLFQSVVVFGVVTLFATGCLFLMQMLEDFRDA
jgi:hypothetical protein